MAYKIVEMYDRPTDQQREYWCDTVADLASIDAKALGTKAFVVSNGLKVMCNSAGEWRSMKDGSVVS